MMTNTEENGSNAGRRRFWLVYPLWILLCAGLFATLQGARDPARPDGRLGEKNAISIGEGIIRGSEELATHQLVHAAWSSAGELGPEARWVLLFRPQAGGLEKAVVVELTGGEGRLIRMRRLRN